MQEPAKQGEIVSKFVDTLEFKRKKVGGVDELDALGKIEELAGLYEAELDQMRTRLAEARTRAEAAEAQGARAQAAEAQAARAASLEGELAQARSALEELRAREQSLSAELAAARTAAEESRAREESLSAKLTTARRTPSPVAAAPDLEVDADDFVRELRGLRADAIARARAEAAAITEEAHARAEADSRAERERRARAAETARTAHAQAESALRKLVDALRDVESLQDALTSVPTELPLRPLIK